MTIRVEVLVYAALVAAASSAPTFASAESALYIDHAPDVRYAAEGDARIAFVPGEALYSYGHDFGKIEPCAGDLDRCIRFDFMALRALSKDDSVGTLHREGAHEFRVAKEYDLKVFGISRRVLRVDVTMDGEPANAYLFDREHGVVAIITYNRRNRDVPESFFLLAECKGVFAKSRAPVSTP